MKRCSTSATILCGGVFATVADAQSPAFQWSDAAAPSSPQRVVAPDFNRDGRPELALCGTGRKSVAVLLKAGGGVPNFTLASEIVAGGGPFELAAGDLSRDARATSASNDAMKLEPRGAWLGCWDRCSSGVSPRDYYRAAPLSRPENRGRRLVVTRTTSVDTVP